MKKNDLTIIALIVLISATTAWNSRFVLLPTPQGYNRYAKHGIAFLHPEDLLSWEVAVLEDGSCPQDGSVSISEDIGTVGWNSGNTDTPHPHDTYRQESSVIWLKSEPPEVLELHLFYNQLYANAVRNRREINMTKGTTGTFTHRNHQVQYQYFNYTIQDIGTTDRSQVYGMVASYYCEKTGRTIEIYYLDIYDVDPVFDQEALNNIFRFYLDSVHCH